jgi:signal transduction histidine kinase
MSRTSRRIFALQRSGKRLRDRLFSRGRPASGEPIALLQIILGQMPGASSLDELLDRTVDALHRVMGNTSTAVLQLLPMGGSLCTRAFQSTRPYQGSAILPIDTGLIGAAARSLQTIVAQDVRADPRFAPADGWEMHAEVCVPIVTRQGLWGVLDLGSERLNAYPPLLVQVAEIVAQQLAIAVENTTLIDQARDQAQLLERRARELTQILTLNSQLHVGMDLGHLLQHLAVSVREVMGFQSVVVNLVDVVRNLAWVAAQVGQTEEEAALLRDATYTWDTFLGDDPERFRVSHSYFIPAEAGYTPPGAFVVPKLDERAPHEWQAEDTLMIPIADHRGEVLGMLSVDDPKDRQRPSLATIQGLEIFASQAAAAIENTRLFAQTQEALHALQESHARQAQLLADVRRTQAELITASKLAGVGTLAAGVAHEFNNLLAGMHGYAELGLHSTPIDKDEALEIIRRTCLRGVHITRSLLTFARQGEGQRGLALLDEIAEGALQLIGRDLDKAGVVVVRDFRSTATILADAGQIMQVVLNLLTNARDAMQPLGGTVTIATNDLDGWVELSVADTGCGIPEGIRERIFEPFATTKGALGGGNVAGSGLGLSVSYGIVQSHEGRLLVESTEGQGSRFTVRLPRGIAAPAPAALAPPAPTYDQRPKHILVVDDDIQVRSMLVALLGRAGHTVAQAVDGQDAVERCEHERWELIISDMTMPRLDGVGMIQQLRQRGVTIPVILMTGRVDGEGLERANVSDACVVIAKPFEASALLAAIAASLR